MQLKAPCSSLAGKGMAGIRASTPAVPRLVCSSYLQPRLIRQQVCQPALQLSSNKHSSSSAACSWSYLSKSLRGSSSSSSTGIVHCYSTAGPQPPAPLDHPIPLLCEVQAWPGPTTTHAGMPTANGSSSSNGSASGSNNGSGPTTISSDSSSTNWPASVAEGQIFDIDAGQLVDMQFDAIMVLAGGLTTDGGLPEWVHRRLDVARGLHLLHHRRPPIVCLGGGTPHKPAILGPNGHVIHESTSCAKYLMDTGVHADHIYKEVSSYDTVGNAYFSLTIHALPSGWRRLAVVTSHFHMPRSRALFADLYQLAGSSLFNDPYWYSLTFLSASDEGVFDDYVYNARLGKEAGSLQHWRSVAGGMRRLSDFHTWLHADHLCYAVPRQHEFGQRTIKDPKLLESY